jgi:hypothetical protein
MVFLEEEMNIGGLNLDLENFKKNATKKFVVINATNGKSLDMKGTTLEETAEVFMALMLDSKKEPKYTKPEILKQGEGLVIQGNNRETGHFSLYLMVPLNKMNNLNVARVIREFESNY